MLLPTTDRDVVMTDHAVTPSSLRRLDAQPEQSRSRSIQQLLVLVVFTGTVVAVMAAGVIAAILSLVSASGH